MANQEQLELLKQGREIWNNWRREHPQVSLDFKDAILENANLNDLDLNGARLINADLIEADLINTNLSHAVLINANLTVADLRGADLSHTLLLNTNLSHAILDRANLSYAMMGQTYLNGIDLHAVKGLETVTFNSAPHISIETLYRSKGIISDIFLRNAGVPDTFISYIHSLVNQPIEYYTCFISYSNYDNDFAERLHADLQFYGVHSFFSPEDLKIGDKFWHRIDESIRQYDKLLVVLSEHSVSSTWVEREVMAALEKEHQRNTLVLLPIKLDDAVKNTTAPWAADIRRSRHLGDFTHWRENYATYQKAFSRLLRDLQTNTLPKL